MNFNEYVKNALRTESKFNVIGTQAINNFLNDRLLHGSIGMQTEVGEIFEAIFIKGKNQEIDEVNLREELGDILWYFAILCDNIEYYDFEFNKIDSILKFDKIEDYIFNINDLTINILDSVKKSLFYRKQLDLDLLKSRLDKIFHFIANLLLLIGGNIEKTAISNIEKLKIRYPEKFNTENAIKRNLEIERSILELDK